MSTEIKNGSGYEDGTLPVEVTPHERDFGYYFLERHELGESDPPRIEDSILDREPVSYQMARKRAKRASFLHDGRVVLKKHPMPVEISAQD